MKVLTFSRYYPKGHRRAGDATFFMEKILCGIGVTMKTLPPHLNGIINDFQMILEPGEHKHHTIRGGNRWKVGDMASLRVWSGKPYSSKKIEFAQVEVKKTWTFEIKPLPFEPGVFIDGKLYCNFSHGDSKNIQKLAAYDGLSVEDFVSWFSIHPKKKEQEFYGQVICWNENIEY